MFVGGTCNGPGGADCARIPVADSAEINNAKRQSANPCRHVNEQRTESGELEKLVMPMRIAG
jgi:hypothetical protein